jgi:tRNA threonylcarbamoyladenosine biosynthesis protein TsaB
MLILTIRTDKPEAEIGLYNDAQQLGYEIWQAHRELSSTIHKKITELLKQQQKAWQDIEGIVCFKGPGSFTGLRIGITIANAAAATLQVPIVSSSGKDWLEKGLARLQNSENEKSAIPEYGQAPHITKQKR